MFEQSSRAESHQAQPQPAPEKKKQSPQEIFDKTKIEIMPVDRFAKIPTNTKQRDTEIRAMKLSSCGGGHLAQLKPEHLVFSIVRDKDGNEMKLDGHTRTFMYQQGWYDLPENVYVLVIAVDSLKEAEERYESYDSQAALKTAANNMQSAYRVNGFKPQSTWIREARGIKTALSWASAFAEGQTGQPVKADVVELVFNYVEELSIIDSLAIEPRLMPAPYLAASLAILKKHGKEVLPFFEKYKAGNEVVENGEKNSIHIINDYIKSEAFIKLRERKSVKAAVKFVTPAAVFVNAFIQWHSNPEADWGSGAVLKFDALRRDFIVSDEE